LSKRVSGQKILHHTSEFRKKLNIPTDFVIDIDFSGSLEELSPITRSGKIVGIQLSLKNRAIPLNVLCHACSHAKHYSMNFPHIIFSTPIKGYQWFLYYTMNEYYTNLIELGHFKNFFLEFLEEHKSLATNICRFEKNFRHFWKNQGDQLKVEILSDFYRIRIIRSDLLLDTSTYDKFTQMMKREYHRVLGHDFLKNSKEFLAEKFPPIPKESYSKDDFQKILNFFDRKNREKFKIYAWEKHP